jgi:hypothetical protein
MPAKSQNKTRKARAPEKITVVGDFDRSGNARYTLVGHKTIDGIAARALKAFIRIGSHDLRIKTANALEALAALPAPSRLRTPPPS